MRCIVDGIKKNLILRRPRAAVSKDARHSSREA
jgi:hypothetical protein